MNLYWHFIIQAASSQADKYSHNEISEKKVNFPESKIHKKRDKKTRMSSL